MALVDLIAKSIKSQIAADAMVGEWTTRAQTVARYREYYDGDHDTSYLTEDMRKALRLEDGEGLNLNYVPVVVDALSNRLRITDIQADNEPATQWLAELMEEIRFDLLQGVVHKSATLDADTYVMVGFDNVTSKTVITHEPAFDGVTGILPFYRSEQSPELICAVKVWQELLRDPESQDSQNKQVLARTRLNFYYADRVEKYVLDSGGKNVLPYVDKDAGETEHIMPWLDRAGQPLGVPVVAFHNRPRGNWGISEAASAISPQTIINRTAYSLTFASEKVGFPNRVGIGFTPPAELAPGDWIEIEGPLSRDQLVDVKILEAADLKQLIELIKFMIREIANVTGTPAPEMFSGDQLSGEAFRERSATLEFKITNAQVHHGAGWEQVFDLAWNVESAFATNQPPDYSRFRTKWAKPNLRSEKDVIGNAVAVDQTGKVSAAEFLRMVASVWDWDQADIDRILSELESDGARNARSALAGLPDFRNAAPGDQGDQTDGLGGDFAPEPDAAPVEELA